PVFELASESMCFRYQQKKVRRYGIKSESGENRGNLSKKPLNEALHLLQRFMIPRDNVSTFSFK
ncbi:hypothetical protein, partial [Vibrio cholerae]|uniref:hypothetical protein n=1 Tax=Vibrio cholerae TaxID=666 RepID=UPI00301DC963